MSFQLSVSESKISRNEQPLPQLHYVVADDWIDKLGEKSFCLYLKLFTLVDRTDSDKQNHCIKTRTSKLLKRLEMSKSTYYRVIKPLYEYGLVDLIEFEGSKNEGSKPVNIMVHRFPQNSYALAVQPLEKCRSWEQRTNENYNFTKDGGRPKKEEATPAVEPEAVIPEPEPEVTVIPEPTPVPEPIPSSVPVPTSVLKFNDEVDFIVQAEYEYFKEAMTNNRVNLSAVVKWINNNAAFIGRNEMCYVLNQLATYPEPIKKTPVFITNAMKHADSEYIPVTQRVQPAPLFG